MSQEPGMSPEREAAVQWALTLVEPLLAPSDRERYLAAMNGACLASPAWAAVLFGGVLADLVLTRPAADRWRALSGRVGQATVGERPPDHDGAVTRAGQAFGSWTDAGDLLTPVFERPDLDPSLAALTSGLSAHAAALLAAGGHGWQAGRGMAEAVLRVGPERSAPAADASTARSSRSHLCDVGHAAVSWALHRRRSYGVTDDPWPVESVYRWSWRAEREVAGQDWPRDVVQTSIEDEKVEALFRDGMIAD